MPFTRPVSVTLLTLLVALGCQQSPIDPGTDANHPRLQRGGKGGGGNSVDVGMTGDLVGTTQSIKGTNSASGISINDDYSLLMNLDIANLVCGDLPGSIPDEPGLVAFVQANTPRSGKLILSYDKSAPEPRQVDSWETTIGGLKYKVQVFRWTNLGHTELPGGTTLVTYRGGSVEVFKKKKGKILSREQCFGPPL